MKDTIVIGKGPAGISAAVYLKRAGLDVTVIGMGYGALEKAEKIENYYGFEHAISGKELVERGIRQAEGLGIEVLETEVTGIAKETEFAVKTTQGDFEARTVLLATGKSRVQVNIPGFEALKGRGISFCAVCDGFFYRGRRLAVIGSGEYAIAELGELLHFTKDITLFTNGQPLSVGALPEGITVVTDKITKIMGQDRVEGIETAENSYPVDGIFVAIGTASAADFAAKLGVLTNGSDIVVDDDFMTNVEGLYAAGDATGGFLQVAKAVSDGAHASKSIIKRVKAAKA